MRILIENGPPHELLTVAGSWSNDPLEGKVFTSIIGALKAASHAGIERFNLVFIGAQAKPFLKLNYR